MSDALAELLNRTVGEPLTVANEFTEVVVRRVIADNHVGRHASSAMLTNHNRPLLTGLDILGQALHAQRLGGALVRRLLAVCVDVPS